MAYPADTPQHPPHSTESLADLLHIQPQSIRAAYCRHGHYLGMVPVKLPNRRLLWPADAVAALITPAAA